MLVDDNSCGHGLSSLTSLILFLPATRRPTTVRSYIMLKHDERLSGDPIPLYHNQ